VLRRDPVAARNYLHDGKAPGPGTIHRLPDLAKTLEAVARDGRDGFYRGWVAEDLVTRLRAAGGLHTLDDFASAKGEYVTPISTAYQGYTVYETPPNSQGIVALEMLNILSGYGTPAGGPMSVERMHLLIEAAWLAYADRDRFVCDPAFGTVPVERLLSAEHAAKQRARIHRDRAMHATPSLLPAHNDTIYLTVVDRDGNAISFINSLYESFGTGLCGPKSGVLLQNRGCGFVVEPGHPNCIGPGKRPMHTIIPGLLAKGDRAVMPFGVRGGHYQATGHVALLANILEYGLDLQEAIDLGRVYPTQLEQFQVEVEDGVPARTAAGLKALGHNIVPAPDPVGGSQAIWIDWESGVFTAGSDPRYDGCAMAL
jgi:gamma-glutamyltranspeptidase/glutathione hydrolase